MSNVFDVAKFILQRQGEMTAMKLQKLVYYAQAWSLVWDEEPLFSERIEAWANGPVVPDLYDRHRGLFRVNASTFHDGRISDLSERKRKTINGVLEFYGSKTAQWLSDLTHLEAPWKDARGDNDPGERCNSEITHAAMHEYYSSL